MNFLTDLHGTTAAILLCALLFADEAGLPIPIAPNEALLLVVGVLIAGGAFPPWVILPAAYLAMGAGMIAGYSWARTVGQTGLRAVAEKVRATEVYDQAEARLQSARPVQIALARMVPGLRPYATLVSGAAGVDLRTFLIGALPALLIWEVVLVTAGVVVGVPVMHLLGRFERVIFRGLVLVALGIISWRAVRYETEDRRGGINRLAPRLRATMALVLDTSIVLSVVSGIFAILRRLLHYRADPWIEISVAAVLLIGLLLIGRNRQTPGETLFGTEYWHGPQHRAEHSGG